MQSADGKYYKTEVADVEQLFKLIQSIPLPKSEPFKFEFEQMAAKTSKNMFSGRNDKSY